MFKNIHSSATRSIAIAPFFLAVLGAVHAQEIVIAEAMPNTIQLIGPYQTEAIIEDQVINERTPCKPKYPQASIRNNEIGTVKLKLLVNVNGYISRAKVVETSGFRDLDRAAMIGYMGCKFKPPVKDGVVTETWIDMQHIWSIE